MELITRQSRANGVAHAWQKQYCRGELYRPGTGQMLCDLGENPNPDTVDEIIGNTSWTEIPACNDCGVEKDAVVLVGEPLDYESYSAHVCLECLQQATRLILALEP